MKHARTHAPGRQRHWVATTNAERGDAPPGAHRAPTTTEARRAGRIAGLRHDAGVARNQGVGAAARRRHPQFPGRPAGPWAGGCWTPATWPARRRAGGAGRAGPARGRAAGAGRPPAGAGRRPWDRLGQLPGPGALAGVARGDDGAVLVNLDAHFDLRTGRPGSSGTPFDQIASYCQERGRKLQYACLGVSRLANTPALFARADEVGAVWVEDRDMGERAICSAAGTAGRPAGGGQPCVPDHRPGRAARGSHAGVSAPAPYGVPMAVVEEIALRVKASGKLRLADMAAFAFRRGRPRRPRGGAAGLACCRPER